MKRHPYYYLLMSTLILAYVAFFYAQKQGQLPSCQGPYELLGDTPAVGVESPIRTIKLYDIITYLKNVDSNFTYQTNEKEFIIAFCHALLRSLNIPLDNLPNELAATVLQQSMPEAYNFFMNLLVFVHNPQEFYNVISTEYDLIKEHLTTDLQKMLQDMLIFIKIAISSNDSIDKNAIKAIQIVADHFICKKFDHSCCKEPGIITLLLYDSLHKDASGKDDGARQLLNEPISALITELDNFITLPSIADPLKVFFFKYASTIITIENQLKDIDKADLSLLQPPETNNIPALLSKSENALAMAKAA